MLEINEALNGRQVDVDVGDEFAIQLVESPTTGYRWQIQELNKSALEVVDDAFRLDSAAVGAGGDRRWLIRAKLPGDFPVTFTKKRSWEQRGVESFTLSIRVSSVSDKAGNQS
jgi:predicted secreted protein